MRDFFRIAAFVISVVMMGPVVSSCSDDEEDVKNPLTEEGLSEYTVMLYGVGGGDLDTFLIYNLNQVQAYGYTDKVNFTGMVKYSANKQDEAGKAGTRLLTMTPEGMHSEKVAESNFRMDDPQNLADFIVSSRERFPAKKYVLVLWNHGLEFSIYDQPVKDSYVAAKQTRALLFDDNVEEDGDDAALSIFELEEALERTGEKLDLLYWDVCNMNMIEHVYQLRDCVDYILGAEHLTPGYGGNYAALIHCLANNPDLVPAVQAYANQAKKTWLNMLGTGFPYDLTLVDVQYVEEVVRWVKVCVDELIRMRDANTPGSQEDLSFYYRLGTSDDEATWFYSPGGFIYFPYNMDEYPATVVDLFYLFREMGDGLYNGILSAYATKLDIELQKLLPVTICIGTPDWVDRVSLGLYFDEGKHFVEEIDGYGVNTISKLYKMLDFDQVVGWSRFIETNTYRKIREVLDEDGNIIYDENDFPLLEEVTE